MAAAIDLVPRSSPVLSPRLHCFAMVVHIVMTKHGLPAQKKLTTLACRDQVTLVV